MAKIIGFTKNFSAVTAWQRAEKKRLAASKAIKAKKAAEARRRASNDWRAAELFFAAAKRRQNDGKKFSRQERKTARLSQ